MLGAAPWKTWSAIWSGVSRRLAGNENWKPAKLPSSIPEHLLRDVISYFYAHSCVWSGLAGLVLVCQPLGLQWARAGFLSLGTKGILGWLSLCCGGACCGMFSTILASTYYMAETRPALPPTQLWRSSVSRQNAWRGVGGLAVCLKLLWLRPVGLDHLTFSPKSPEYLEE